MKRLLLFLLLAPLYMPTFAQVKDTTLLKPIPVQTKVSLANDTLLARLDLSPIWLQTENAVVYGYIGEDYERIRIKFITVTKDKTTNDTYHVYGKSMVKKNITEFRGTLKITQILKREINERFKDKIQYALTGDYKFTENRNLPHSGIFSGFFVTGIYTDKAGNAHYDDIDIDADGFFNNKFTGEWTNYNGMQAKRCNWGDYRIPNSGNLDVGAGEFAPADEYLKFGWQNLQDAFSNEPKGEAARKEEEREWWK